MDERNPNDLDRHPMNQAVYGEETLPEDFIHSIENRGVQEPVVISNDDTIISGHRRVEAAKQVGLKSVPVRIEEFDSVLERREAIIHYNKQRTKTFSQKMREALELEKIEKERAKKRQGARTDITQNFARSELGSTRDKVAEYIDVSGETYRKAKAVWSKAGEGVERFEREVKKIDAGDQSIHGAYKKLKSWEELQKLDDAVDWGTVKKAGIIDNLVEREKTFNDACGELNQNASWIESLRILKNHHSEVHKRPRQGDTYVYAYLLEAKSGVDLPSEDSTSTSLVDRKPDAETLESDYWGVDDDAGLDLQEIAVKYGVHEELVLHWLREDEIFLKVQEFNEPERNRLRRVK